MPKSRIVLAGLALASFSCASVEPKTEPVELRSNPAAVRSCQFLAFVESSDSGATTSEAESALRTAAARQGGNVLLLLTQSTIGGTHDHSSGEAYSCAEPPSLHPPHSFVAAEHHSRLDRVGPYCPPPID